MQELDDEYKEARDAIGWHHHNFSSLHEEMIILANVDDDERTGCLYCPHCRRQARELLKPDFWQPEDACPACVKVDDMRKFTVFPTIDEHVDEYETRKRELMRIAFECMKKETKKHRLERETEELLADRKLEYVELQRKNKKKHDRKRQLNDELADREAELADCETELAERKAELADCESELEDRKAELA